MKIGQLFNRRGQTYEYRGEAEYRNRNGDSRPLLRLRSRCADCGSPFDFKTTRYALKAGQSLNRRCQKHTDPGRPVAAPLPPPPDKVRDTARRLARLVDEHNGLEARLATLAATTPAAFRTRLDLQKVRAALPGALGVLQKARRAEGELAYTSRLARVESEGARAEAAAAESILAELKAARERRKAERRAAREVAAANARAARAERAAAKRAARDAEAARKAAARPEMEASRERARQARETRAEINRAKREARARDREARAIRYAEERAAIDARKKARRAKAEARDAAKAAVARAAEDERRAYLPRLLAYVKRPARKASPNPPDGLADLLA